MGDPIKLLGMARYVATWCMRYHPKFQAALPVLRHPSDDVRQRIDGIQYIPTVQDRRINIQICIQELITVRTREQGRLLVADSLREGVG